MQIILDQNGVSALDCHIGASTNGDADISLNESRGVVDAVSDHRDGAVFRLEPFHFLRFTVRQHRSPHGIDSDFSGYRMRRPAVVACNQRDLQVRFFQLADRAGGLRFDLVRQCNSARKPAVSRREDHRFTVAFQPISDHSGRFEIDAVLFEQRLPAHQPGPRVQTRSHTDARPGEKLFGGLQGKSPVFSLVHDRFGQRMLRSSFNGSHRGQQLIFTERT